MRVLDSVVSSTIGSVNIDDLDGFGGDELDEGFDEEIEFEFYDADENKKSDDNDEELQRILIQQAVNLPLSNVLLDDLGVDVLDSNEFLDCSLDQPLSSYQQQSLSPVSLSPCDSTTTMDANTYNNSLFPVSNSFMNFEPAAVNSNYYSSANMPGPHVQPDSSWCNPILSSVNLPQDMMDLNEVAIMASSLPELTITPQTNSYVMTPTSPHTPMSEARSPATNRVARSLSPAPSPYTYNAAAPLTPSSGAYYVPSPVESTQSVLSNVCFSKSSSDQIMVEMPFHKFKKYLDDPTVADSEKERLKCLRRRGKNKVAAKNCREKKMTMISGLQQEVNQMRVTKARLDTKTRGLELEIERLKKFCAHRRR